MNLSGKRSDSAGEVDTAQKRQSDPSFDPFAGHHKTERNDESVALKQ